MPNDYAFVTLLTSPAYLPGVLTAAQSLLDAEGHAPARDFDTVCLVTPETVTADCIKALRATFTLVVGVDAINSKSTRELALLGRPELDITLTKLHLWRLTQYTRIIYLDADTLVLRPLSHLFHTTAAHEFAAAPDIGWPDCFNSGMFVARPSHDTFTRLLDMADSQGSWDGGDQGLLNDFFPNWHRLSFTYNVTPSASYQYVPALQRYGKNISVLHFIGRNKPWSFLDRSRISSSGTDQNNFLLRWYEVYEKYFGQLPTTRLATFFARTSAPHANFVVPVYANVSDKRSRVDGFRAPTLQDLQSLFSGKMVNSGEALLAAGDASSAQVLLEARQTNSHRQDSARASTTQMPLVVEPARLSPGMLAWNPATSEPDRTQLQMREPLDTSNYTNVWDDAGSKQTRTFFSPPEYQNVPQSIQADYQRVMQSARSSKDVKPVFPWEGHQQKAARVFPDDKKQGPLGAPLRSPHDPQHQHQHQQQHAQASSTPDAQSSSANQGLPTELNYANAWDSISGIKKYADALAKPPPSPPQWKASFDEEDAMKNGSRTSNRKGGSRSRGQSIDNRGEEGDDEDEDARPPIKLRTSRNNSGVSSPASRLPANLRPGIFRAEGSMGSHSRVPTMADLTSDAAAELPDLPGQRAVGSITKSLNLPTPANRKSLVPSPLASPSSNVSMRDLQSQATAQQAPSRVFSPATDTGIVRKEGLAALQRFVQSMDSKGSAPSA